MAELSPHGRARLAGSEAVPGDGGGVEDRTVGAGQAVGPGVGVGAGDAYGNGAGLAGANAAGHSLFEGDLAGDVELLGQAGDASEHGGGAAGEDVKMGAVGGMKAAEQLFQGVGDQAFEAEGAVFGGQDQGTVEAGELFGTEAGLAGRIGGLVGKDGQGQEIGGGDPGQGEGGLAEACEGFGQIQQGGQADAAGDQEGLEGCGWDLEGITQGAQESEFLAGDKLSQPMSGGADGAVNEVDPVTGGGGGVFLRGPSGEAEGTGQKGQGFLEFDL